MIKIALPLIAILFCSSCTRENPLLDKDPMIVATWVYENSETAYKECPLIWMSEAQSPNKACNKKASELAAHLTSNGFGNIVAKDIKIPSIWLAYDSVVSKNNMNKYDPEKAKNSFKIKLKKQQ